MANSELFDLHKKYDSIKVRDKFVYSWEYVNTIYPRYIDPIRYNKLNVLEVGIMYGGAVQAFRDYLPNSKIIGFDFELRPRITDMSRIELVQGDQSDAEKLTEVGNRLGPFDIVIDDACHKFQPQLATFNAIWPFVKPGGFYFIEDVFPYGGGQDSTGIFDYMKDKVLLKDVFANKPHGTDFMSMTFFPTMIVLEKR